MGVRHRGAKRRSRQQPTGRAGYLRQQIRKGGKAAGVLGAEPPQKDIRGGAPDRMEEACEASLSCGQVVLYRAFLEDLEKVYLSGLQVIGA